jgi:hypothetical protein
VERCGILWNFAEFCGTVGFCGILWNVLKMAKTTCQSSNDQGGRSVRRSAVVRQAVRVATEWATHVFT